MEYKKGIEMLPFMKNYTANYNLWEVAVHAMLVHEQMNTREEIIQTCKVPGNGNWGISENERIFESCSKYFYK